MDITKFLSTVLPDSGELAISTLAFSEGNGGTYGTHWVKNIDGVTKVVDAINNYNKPVNIYVGMAGFNSKSRTRAEAQ